MEEIYKKETEAILKSYGMAGSYMLKHDISEHFDTYGFKASVKEETRWNQLKEVVSVQFKTMKIQSDRLLPNPMDKQEMAVSVSL